MKTIGNQRFQTRCTCKAFQTKQATETPILEEYDDAEFDEDDHFFVKRDSDFDDGTLDKVKDLTKDDATKTPILNVCDDDEFEEDDSFFLKRESEFVDGMMDKVKDFTSANANVHLTTGNLNFDKFREEYDFQELFVEKNDNEPHPNLVEPLGWYKSNTESMIIMENAPFGHLTGLMKEAKIRTTERYKLILFRFLCLVCNKMFHFNTLYLSLIHI